MSYGWSCARSVGSVSPPMPVGAVDPRADQHLDLDLLVLQRLDQLRMLVGGPLDQEDLGLAPRVGESLGPVVDRATVAATLGGDELGAEGIEVGLFDDLLKRPDVDPAVELDGYRLLVAGGRHAGSLGLLEDLERPAGRLAGANHHVDVDPLPLLHVGGDRYLLDQDLAVIEVLDRHDVDLHAQRLGLEGLLQQVAAVLVAVGDDDHAPRGVLGERGQGQFDRRGDVGVLGIDRVLDPQQVELAGLGRNLDPGLAAEDDHAGHVVPTPLLGRLGGIIERRLLVRLGDAVGGVDQEHRRQAVGDPHRLHLRQRQHDQSDHRDAQEDRQRAADRPQSRQAAVAHPDQRRDDQRDQD